MLKLGGCTGGTTSTLPTGYQREPSLGSQVSMLLLAVPAIVLPTGLTRRSATTSAVSQPNQPLSSAASRPELVRHPTCTLPIGLPSFSRVPWHTGTWQCVASRRLVWSPSPFRPALSLCPSLGRGPELAKLREARALLSRQCRRTPHPPRAWQSFGAGLVQLLQREPKKHEKCPAEQHYHQGAEGARTVVRIDQKENERKNFRRRGAALPEALPLTLLSASRLLVFQAFQVLYSFPRTL